MDENKLNSYYNYTHWLIYATLIYFTFIHLYLAHKCTYVIIICMQKCLA